MTAAQIHDLEYRDRERQTQKHRAHEWREFGSSKRGIDNEPEEYKPNNRVGHRRPLRGGRIGDLRPGPEVSL
jgi:hypothetical protein